MKGLLGFLTGTIVGHYRIAALTGLTTGMGAGATIFSARWGNTTPVRPLIIGLKITESIVTPFTAAQEVNASAFVARAFTAKDTGGTGITLTGQNQVQNSIADAPTVATINVATTSGLTLGTRTVDSSPILSVLGAQLLAAATAAGGPFFNEWKLYSDMEFPFNLQCAEAAAANAEGIIVTSPIAQGAGGTVRFGIEMEWVEFAYGPGVSAPGVA